MSDDIYTRSNGQQVKVSEMPYQHLKSAHAKLAREFPGHPEIIGMDAEINRRDAEHAAKQDQPE